MYFCHNLLLMDIIQYTPQIILWSNKFNTTNIIGQSNYRNKDILKYEFSNAKKTQFCDRG